MGLTNGRTLRLDQEAPHSALSELYSNSQVIDVLVSTLGVADSKILEIRNMCKNEERIKSWLAMLEGKSLPFSHTNDFWLNIDPEDIPNYLSPFGEAGKAVGTRINNLLQHHFGSEKKPSRDDVVREAKQYCANVHMLLNDFYPDLNVGFDQANVIFISEADEFKEIDKGNELFMAEILRTTHEIITDPIEDRRLWHIYFSLTNSMPFRDVDLYLFSPLVGKPDMFEFQHYAYMNGVRFTMKHGGIIYIRS